MTLSGDGPGSSGCVSGSGWSGCAGKGSRRSAPRCEPRQGSADREQIASPPQFRGLASRLEATDTASRRDANPGLILPFSVCAVICFFVTDVTNGWFAALFIIEGL